MRSPERPVILDNLLKRQQFQKSDDSLFSRQAKGSALTDGTPKAGAVLGRMAKYLTAYVGAGGKLRVEEFTAPSDAKALKVARLEQLCVEAKGPLNKDLEGLWSCRSGVPLVMLAHLVTQIGSTGN